MAIEKILTYDTELNEDIGYTVHPISLALGEANGHTIKVNVLRGGTKVTDSATCRGKFLRADGSTVEFNGTFSSGIAAVTLPSACYTKEGACKLSVYLVNGSQISCVFVLIANVLRYTSTEIVDSNQVVPNIETLLANVAKIEAIANDVDAINKKIGHVEKSGSTLKFYSDITKSKLIASIDIPAGNDSNKVGYAEYDDGVLSLYADSTKAKLIKAVVIPSGGGTGGGITTSQLKAMIGEIIAVDDDMVTEMTEIIMGDSTEELEVPSIDEFNEVKNSVDVVRNASKSAAAGKVWTATSTGAEWKDAPSGGSGGVTGNYTKPSDGIPKSDLASSVQSSLSKADTALQSVPSTYALKSDIPTSDISSNTSARHTHSNKSVLDGITAAKVAKWDSNTGGSSGGSSGGGTTEAFATLEQFGGIAGDSSATARAANTKAVTDAILAGYNIKCEGGITADGVKTYSFSGVVDVRAIKYRSIDIDLNGCRFSDFHIIANVIDDSAMTETSCSWAWQNGNKFYLAIHDGLIGASTSYEEMTSLPKQPIAITGLIPRFKNLQVIGKVHICAMPPIYCDQMYFENIKLVGSSDSVWEYWDTLDNICVITGKDSNGYIYKNNGDGCRLNGDQFRFTEINDGRHFFTMFENLGTIVSDCIASSFSVNNSMVKFINCHNESGQRRTPIVNSITRGGYTDVILEHCYMEQHAFEVFANMSATVLGCVSMVDCEVRIGVLAVAGHSDPHVCNFLEALYKMKYQRGNKIASMDRYILPRTKVPSDIFCVASTTPNISTNTSLTKVATGVYDANFKPGTYSYTVAYHNACALQSAVKTETKSVTISAQATLNRFAIENYGGQMISLYKSDGANTYRAIVPSYPTVGTFTLMLDDCGAFISIWNYNTRTTADSSFARETIKDAVLWELVSSKPTISVNSNIRSCGSMIYDTSGKLYSTNGNSLTAIN